MPPVAIRPRGRSLWGDTARNATSEPQADPTTVDTSVQSGHSDAGALGSARFSRYKNANAAFGGPETVLQPKHNGSNHAPVMNQAIRNFNRVLLLPHGPAALVEFTGEPASDVDGNELTYSFHFALFEMTGTQTPEGALLRIMRKGNRFEILPDGDISPAEFVAVHGNYATISGVQTAITASDGTDRSDYQQYHSESGIRRFGPVYPHLRITWATSDGNTLSP